MKLEVAMLAGHESKEFLQDLTVQVDRLDKLLAKMQGITTTAAPEAETESEDEDFAAKPAKVKAKKAAKSFDDDETEEKGGEEDEDEKDEETEEDDEEGEDEKDEEGEDEKDEEEEKPAKTAKGKTPAKAKKVTADDVNDACKAHAKAKGRDATLKILTKKFKVKSITELKPEQYEDVITAVALEEDEE